MEQPIKYWVPSIAPSGMAFYDGNLFPEWKGSLLVSALVPGDVRRLTLNGSTSTQTVAGTGGTLSVAANNIQGLKKTAGNTAK